MRSFQIVKKEDQRGGLTVEAVLGELVALFEGESQPAVRKVMYMSLFANTRHIDPPHAGHSYSIFHHYSKSAALLG